MLIVQTIKDDPDHNVSSRAVRVKVVAVVMIALLIPD